MTSPKSRTGVWLIGARGSVATTVVVGAAALAAGLAPTTGCVTELPDFRQAELPGYSDLVFGGHDIAVTPLAKRAEALAAAGVFAADLLTAARPALDAAEAEIRPGVAHEAAGEPQARQAATLVEQLRSFRTRLGLRRVVVVNLASTEPPTPWRPEHQSLDALERALAAHDAVLPPSALYAYAALRAGCPYADFTPSLGGRIPALAELADALRLPYAGSDGKTGETLVKSALGPMFRRRALRVRAWSGLNLLGGGDGATLAEPAAARSKTASKERGLAAVLGAQPDGQVHIDYVEALGDWKTAWDHIVFEGFLGVRMSMQFTWQGCDSALAAPLVLDLARLLALAHHRGQHGPQPQLGFFFKDPVGAAEHSLTAQYEALRAWAAAT